jgi:hypothetical protein
MLVLEGTEVNRRDVINDRQAMLEAFDHLGPIEQWLVCQQVQRLGNGQAQYGKLKDSDTRDWSSEAIMELLDSNQYLMLELRRLIVARQTPQRDTEPCAADLTIEVGGWDE